MSRQPGHRSPKHPAQPDRETEQVGYCKPPSSTQFKPGHSGNLNGRPKGSRNLATQVRAVLSRRIPVLEHGERKSLPAAEALLHRYLEMALKGDVKAGAFLLGLLERFQPAEAVEPVADVLSEQDKEIVANLFRQFNNGSGE